MVCCFTNVGLSTHERLPFGSVDSSASSLYKGLLNVEIGLCGA